MFNDIDPLAGIAKTQEYYLAVGRVRTDARIRLLLLGSQKVTISLTAHFLMCQAIPENGRSLSSFFQRMIEDLQVIS